MKIRDLKVKEINIDGELKLRVVKKISEDEYIVECPDCSFKKATFNMDGKLYCKKCPQIRFFG